LLGALLRFNPAERITVTDALCHGYFEEASATDIAGGKVILTLVHF
jgi:hypothetical protein